MRIFTTKLFSRFAKRERITDHNLCEAIERAERGIVDADLGGNIVKQRIARDGQGRSRGYRAVIAYKTLKRAVFLYGFAKNERDNMSDVELISLKELAKAWLNATDKEINNSIAKGLLQEVHHEKKI